METQFEEMAQNYIHTSTKIASVLSLFGERTKTHSHNQRELGED